MEGSCALLDCKAVGRKRPFDCAAGVKRWVLPLGNVHGCSSLRRDGRRQFSRSSMLTCCTGGLHTVNEAFCFAQTPERERGRE